jgi:ABC-type iron transport system FetAB ATPase subunit
MDKQLYKLDKVSYSYLDTVKDNMYIPIAYQNARMQTTLLSDLKEYINKDLSYQVSYLSDMINNLQSLVNDLSTWKY